MYIKSTDTNNHDKSLREWETTPTLNTNKGDVKMYFEVWALWLIGLGLMSFGSLVGIAIMSILIITSNSDDKQYGDGQYYE